MIISIDGYSGAGKTTQQHRLAAELGFQMREYLGALHDHRYEELCFAFHEHLPGFMQSEYDWKLYLLMAEYASTQWEPNLVFPGLLHFALCFEVDQRRTGAFIDVLSAYPDLSIVLWVPRLVAEERLNVRNNREAADRIFSQQIRDQWEREDEIILGYFSTLEKEMPFPVRIIDGTLPTDAVTAQILEAIQ